MTRAPYLVVDDNEDRISKYRLSWYIPEDEDIGGSVGDATCWESRSKAQASLRIVKAAIAAGVDRPMPDWATKALAAGWKAPKGWKP